MTAPKGALLDSLDNLCRGFAAFRPVAPPPPPSFVLKHGDPVFPHFWVVFGTIVFAVTIQWRMRLVPSPNGPQFCHHGGDVSSVLVRYSPEAPPPMPPPPPGALRPTSTGGGESRIKARRRPTRVCPVRCLPPRQEPPNRLVRLLKQALNRQPNQPHAPLPPHRQPVPHTQCPSCKLNMCHSPKCAILIPESALPFLGTAICH